MTSFFIFINHFFSIAYQKIQLAASMSENLKLEHCSKIIFYSFSILYHSYFLFPHYDSCDMKPGKCLFVLKSLALPPISADNRQRFHKSRSNSLWSPFFNLFYQLLSITFSLFDLTAIVYYRKIIGEFSRENKMPRGIKSRGTPNI